MERSEYINIIADALSNVTGHTFCGVVNSRNDDKFPVYVTHSIDLFSQGSDYRCSVRVRVHSGLVDKDVAFREIATQLLTSVFCHVNSGRLLVVIKEPQSKE
jgi:hypothetical protein